MLDETPMVSSRIFDIPPGVFLSLPVILTLLYVKYYHVKFIKHQFGMLASKKHHC